MRALTIRSGVKEANYDALLNEKSLKTYDAENIYVWLLEIREGPYKRAEKIWSCHDERRWKLLFDLEEFELEEVRLLRERFAELRKQWRKPLST